MIVNIVINSAKEAIVFSGLGNTVTGNLLTLAASRNLFGFY